MKFQVDTVSVLCSGQNIRECSVKQLGQLKTATSFFLPHQNLAKSHHLSSGAKDLKPLKYINTDIREQNIYNYD